ncbi:MAG: LysM peptidoglycan-binding domain-containing protein, partial [Desulfatitalea sp.]|nr:LysM peptidoglycan-binding domain-containing protein [Desulfatitalea sp.]
HKEYFGELALAAPVPYRTHVLDGYVSFSKLSQHFGVAPEVLKQLNPALRQPVVAGQKHVPKGYALRLPATSESTETLIAQVIPETLYQKDQKPTRFYTVQRGDTVGKIARSHGVEADELILANNLDRRATIVARQTLRIPARGEKPSPPELPVLLASNAPTAIAALPENEVAAPAPEAKAPVAVATAAVVETKASVAEISPPVEETRAPVLAPKAPEAKPGAPMVVAAAEPAVAAQARQKVEQSAPAPATAPEPAAPAVGPKTEIAAVPSKPAELEIPAVEPGAPKAASEAPALVAAAQAPVKPQAVQKEQPAAPATKEPPLAQYPQPMLASVIPMGSGSAAPEKETLTLEALRQQVSNDQIVAADVGFESIIKVKGQPVGVIQIEIEETLGHYADWADVRTQQIRNLNGLSFNSVIHLHQKIKIPLHRVTAEAFEQNRYEFHKRLQEDFFAVYRIDELQDYFVQHGDNYWTLSQSKFEIPMWLLKHCNPETDLADLQINQKLIIPVVGKASADDASPADEQGTEEETPNQEGGTPSRSTGEV